MWEEGRADAHIEEKKQLQRELLPNVPHLQHGQHSWCSTQLSWELKPEQDFGMIRWEVDINSLFSNLKKA